MISMYRERRDADMFLSNFFQAPPENFFAGEKVAIDIERSGEDIATIVTKRGTGPNMNSTDVFTTKEYTPPTYNEGAPFNVYDLLNRMPGVNEYNATAVSWDAQMMNKISSNFNKLENMIKRGIELQASQVMQTGTITFNNKSGSLIETVDFKPKATHFPTAAILWNAAGYDPLGDLASLAAVIRADSLQSSNRLIFGDTALQLFLSNDEVKDRLDNRRMVLGDVALTDGMDGGEFHGRITIGQYTYEIWSYDGRYKDPATGVSTAYIGSDKVVMLGRSVRLDKLFAGVPRVTPIDPRFSRFLPGRVSMVGIGDFHPNIYASQNGKELFIELETRPLLTPTAIDGFGCITVL